jgi:hypothetical protein
MMSLHVSPGKPGLSDAALYGRSTSCVFNCADSCRIFHEFHLQLLVM